jgi:hypothetical protein
VNLLGSKEVLLQKSLQQDSAHLAGAQNGHADLGQLRGNFGGLNGYLRHDFPCLQMKIVVQLFRILALEQICPAG